MVAARETAAFFGAQTDGGPRRTLAKSSFGLTRQSISRAQLAQPAFGIEDFARQFEIAVRELRRPRPFAMDDQAHKRHDPDIEE